MTLHIDGPTREQMARGVYERPEQTRTTVRTSYRRLCPHAQLAKREDIDGPQAAAASKLEKHWLGSQGVDVRSGEPAGDTDIEPEAAHIYHAQKYAEARRQVLPEQWAALTALIEEEWSLEDIGRTYLRMSDRKACRAAGLVLVRNGLDMLCILWGLRSRATNIRDTMR